MITLDNPQAAADIIKPHLGLRVTASISGQFGSGKTSALAAIVGAAVASGMIGLHEMAVYAPTGIAIRRLRAMIGEHWPELAPQSDLFARELSGTPTDAYFGHTALEHDDGALPMDRVKREYLDVLRRLNSLTDDPRDVAFLRGLSPKVEASLRFDIERRKRGDPLPLMLQLHGAADFLKAYKARNNIVDDADLLHGDYYHSKQVRLVLLDETGDEDRARLLRFFPNASVIATSVEPQPADISMHLPRCLRQPERWDIVDHKASPFLIPPPDDFASLFILTNPWRHGIWLHWLATHGIPPPLRYNWRAMVAAYRLDQGETVRAYDINPLLRRAGLQPDLDRHVDRDEIEGWSNWRDVGAADVRTRDHLDAVLKRYGGVSGLPFVKLVTPPTVRQAEADVVIFDCAGGRPGDASIVELALTRAKKRLIVLQGETVQKRLSGDFAIT